MNIGYWPANAPREVTVEAFISAYGMLGYEPCSDGELEPVFQKIVIYARAGKPTHVARQLDDGTWTSKLGQWVDIEHDDPDEVLQFPNCSIYGQPVQFLKRRRAQP
jgi:hypothetical protein